MPNYSPADSVTGRILVIDDDPATVEILETQLSADGHKVDTAYTGAAGLEHFHSNKYEVVLTDLRIGDMSGIDVLKNIRSTDNEVAVIILTGYASTESAVNAVKLGANDYMLKPLKLLQLSQTIQNQVKSVALVRQVEELNKAVAVERDKLRRSVAELTMLKRLAERMASVMTFLGGFEVIINLLVEDLEADIAVIYDIERDTARFTSKAGAGRRDALHLGQLLQDRARNDFELKLEFVPESLFDAQGSQDIDDDGKIASTIIVPLIIEDQPIGFLVAASRTDEHYERDLARFISKLAGEASEFLLRVRKSVERQRHFTASIVEHTLDGIIVIDPHADEMMMNPIGREILNVVPEKRITAKDVEQILQINLSEIVEELQSIEDGNIDHKHLTMQSEISRGGNKNFYGLTVSNLPGSENEEPKLLMVIHDVTKDRQVEEMKNQLISNITHEVRTPTGVIREFISLMLDGVAGELNESQQHYMTIMKSNIDRLGRLIENLLTFARADTGGFSVVLASVDVPPIIEEVARSIEIKLKRKNIVLKCNVPDDLPPVFADQDAVMQVLINLVDNAYKYSPEETEIAISAEISGGRVTIAVKDEGYGIEEVDRERIFKRFQRLVDADDPRFQEGVGLGLALVKELVIRHGGDIWLESEVGSGSTFYFSLQIAKDEEEFKPA